MGMLKVTCTLFLVFCMCCTINGEIGYSRKYITSRGKICTDCAHHGKPYEWCYTGNDLTWDWDYCSTNPKLTTRQEPCLSECKLTNDGYQCDTNVGWFNSGWDYCGKTLDLSYRQFTSENEECQDICKLDNDYTFKCHNLNWEFKPCSHQPGMASNGRTCLNDACEVEDGKGSCITNAANPENRTTCSRFLNLIDPRDSGCIPPDETGFDASVTTARRTNCQVLQRESVSHPVGDLDYEASVGKLRQPSEQQLKAAKQLINDFEGLKCSPSVVIAGTIFPKERPKVRYGWRPKLNFQGSQVAEDVRLLNFQLELESSPVMTGDDSAIIAAVLIPENVFQSGIGLRVLASALTMSLSNMMMLRIRFTKREPKSTKFDIFDDQILPECPTLEVKDLSLYSDYAAAKITYSDVSYAARGITDIQNRTGQLLMFEDHDMFPMSARQLWNEALGAAIAVQNLEDRTPEIDILSELDTLYIRAQAIATRLELEVQRRNEIPIQRYINAMKNDAVSEAYIHINVTYKQLNKSSFNRIFADAIKQLYHEICFNRDQKFLLFLMHATPNEETVNLVKDIVAGEMMHYDVTIPCYVKYCSGL